MVVRDQRPQPKMEKPKGRRRNMKTHYLCMPRLRSSSPCTKNNSRLSPMSLLERLREAVFRLIMLSALSKATHQNGSGDAHGSYYRPTYEPHHSEAVADCIEFIKKSATTEENRDSTASSSIDATTEVVIPVPNRSSISPSLSFLGLLSGSWGRCSQRARQCSPNHHSLEKGKKMAGGQSEREDKVSLEITEEILQSMEVGMAFRDYNGRISSMDFHRTSSYLVTASDDESIRLYDVANATCLKTINSKKYGVDLVSFTSHPTTVIYSSKNGWDESLRLLSLHDNKYLRYFKGHHDRVVSLSLCSRKECFISGSLDRTVMLWDQRAEKCQGLLRVQGRPATAYDDQGLVFAIAFGGYIRMFDTRKYEKGPFEIFSAGGDMSDANVVKFSNDGRLMLLTTMDGHIHVIDSFRGTLLSTYNVKPVSSNSTLEASFSPEGMFVISGSGDGSVYAWSVRSGKEVASWMSTETEPPVIKWASGNLMFVTGSSELSFWIPDLSKLAAYVGRK